MNLTEPELEVLRAVAGEVSMPAPAAWVRAALVHLNHAGLITAGGTPTVTAAGTEAIAAALAALAALEA